MDLVSLLLHLRELRYNQTIMNKPSKRITFHEDVPKPDQKEASKISEGDVKYNEIFDSALFTIN